MTQLFPFQFKTRTLFSFQPLLDGQLYNATVPYGIFGRRPYLTITSLDNVRVGTWPLVGTPDPIPLAACVWDELLGVVVVTAQAPHGLRIGSVVNMTVVGVTSGNYNGAQSFTVAGPSTLTYAQTTDPGGPSTQQGTVSALTNIVEGFFTTSTLILRESSQTIEINP